MEILGDSMPFSESTLVGFKVTLASTLEITDMMHNECGFEYFMTSRLSQDYLEQLFSIMRYSCGSNEHPDAKLFLQVFRLFCLFSLIRPPKGSNVTGVELLQSFIQNKDTIKASKKTHEEWILKLYEALENCALPGDQVLLYGNEQGQKEASDNDNSKDLNQINLPKTVRENEDKLIDHDYNVTYTSEQVLAYLAGYVSRKMKKKYEFCKNCFDSLSSAGSVEENQQNELINELSLYGGLAYPSQGLFELTRRLENTVLDVVGKKGIEGNTIQMIFDRITQIQLPKIGCHEHSLLLTREIIIYHLTMRGHFLAKTLNKEYIGKKNKSKMYKKLSRL
ncbi:uncharacterized protein LOC130902943 [Diorhabda carinulata]|uniref:uncharacterized protein LOC130902943 n=1 Tax=Diorhabda carinulata TaxID=1163345 RepID=UPI0025A13B2F|nr:uncharacterized protein LOC130902943 [Diorhabda carinulata]